MQIVKRPKFLQNANNNSEKTERDELCKRIRDGEIHPALGLREMKKIVEEENRALKQKAKEEARRTRTLRMNRLEKKMFYFFMHKDDVVRTVAAALGVIICFGFHILFHYTDFLNISFGSNDLLLKMEFSSIPCLVLMGVFGLVPGMIGFTMSLLFEIFTSGSHVYMMAVILFAQIILYQRVKRKALFSFRRTALLVAGLTFTLGNVYSILVHLAEAKGFQDLSGFTVLFDFLEELPEIIIAVGIIRLVLVRLPEKYRKYLIMGDYYSQDPKVEARVQQQRMPSRLERKITRLIVFEALTLGIAAAGFANALIPDVADSVIEEFHDNERRKNYFDDIVGTFGSSLVESDTEDVSASDTSETDTSDSDNSDTTTSEEKTLLSQQNNALSKDERDFSGNERPASRRRFVMNKTGLAFDIKLIMMLLNIAIPFVIISVYIAKRQIAMPIDSMATAMKDFCDAPEDEKDSALYTIHDLDIITNDEIGMLYGTMDQMAENVVDYVASVKREQQLQEDLRVAQASAEAKSQFFSQMSHELRTPINAVLGLDEMIIRESRENTIRDYAIDIKSAGRSLLSLINDILDNSKLEAGKMEIISVEYELSSVINDLVNMIQTKADEKGLAFEVKVDENIPHLLAGDEVRIKQVILNILSNGVKYTEKGSVTLDMSYEKKDDEHITLEVHVVDTGIGIKPDDLEKLYTPFARLDEKRNRYVEGTGLGMNIVKQLLDLMGSSLEVKSTYGEGSDFHFRLEQRVVKWEPIGAFSESYERARASIEKYQESFIAPDARILVVDDTKLNLTVAAGLIKETLVGVDTADSGQAALRMVSEKEYDIIFLDHMMPGMDGIETLKAMRELEDNKCKDAPVIALTANAVSGARSTYMEAGFDDYLTKPIDSKRFEAMIMQYLPEEKVLPPDDHKPMVPHEPQVPGTVDSEAMELRSDGSDEYAFLRDITCIDYDTAIMNTGNDELLATVLHDYVEAIPAKSSDIERYWKEQDYHNYGILVHALKSSSRLIGATALSELALSLEEASKSAEGGDKDAIAVIDEKTPGLIKDYRSYFDKLTPVFSDRADKDMRPEISGDDLREALHAMREFANAFDFDSADMVMAQVRDYRVPAEYEGVFEDIRRALADVDQARLVALLDEALG